MTKPKRSSLGVGRCCDRDFVPDGRCCTEIIERLEAQLTAILAESTRWQREAQTTEERAWANVYHAAITRAMKEAA